MNTTACSNDPDMVGHRVTNTSLPTLQIKIRCSLAGKPISRTQEKTHNRGQQWCIYGLVFLCLHIVNAVYAQKFSSLNYTQKDGLPVSQVQAIAQDKAGFLWLGVGDVGLVKFDGRTFENFQVSHGLNSSTVTSLKYARDTLWIGTTRGLNFLVNDRIYRYPGVEWPGVIGQIESGTGDEIFIATPEAGVYCLSATNGLKRYTKVHGFSDEPVTDIEYDDNGKAWLMTTRGDVFMFEDGTFTCALAGLDSALSVHCVNDTLLIGTNRKLLYHAKKNKQWTLVKEKNIRSEVFDIQVQDNELWLAIRDGLLWQRGNSFLWLGDQNGLTNTPVLSLYKDREGILWAGTAVQGLYKILREPFVQLQLSPTTYNDVVRDIRQIDENYSVVSTLGKGAFKVDRQLQATQLSLPPEIRNVYDIRPMGIDLFVASFEGRVGWMANGVYHPFAMPDFAMPPSVIGEHGNGLFLSDRTSLFLYQRGTFQKFLTENPIASTLSLDTAVLLASHQGLHILYNDSVRKIRTHAILDQSLIGCLARDENSNIFIGTSGHGLWVLPKGDAGQPQRIPEFPLDIVRSMLVDENKVYCGTHQGLYVLTLGDDLRVNQVVWLGRDNGFMGIECMTNALVKNTNGKIWIGTINGAFVFDPKANSKVRARPTVLISQLRNIKTQQSYFENSSIPPFAYGEGDLAIEFQGMSLLAPRSFRYQYRLVGQSDRWSSPSTQTQAQFTNLAPGKYTFEVKIVDFLSQEIARSEMTFSVLAPFWQKDWFIILVLVILLAFIYGLLQLRVRRALQAQHEAFNISRELRRELARDFHDELGNHLASILSLLHVLKLRAPHLPPSIKQPIALLEKKAQDLFFGTKDFIYSIDPENETLEWTILYLKDFGEQLFGVTNTRFETEPIRDWQKDITVKAYYARGLILIFKECMTNIVKHAQATEVKFEITKQGRGLRFELFDNGVGIEQAHLETSEGGLRNIRERAAKLGATLHISSRKGATTIILEIENYAHWSK